MSRDFLPTPLQLPPIPEGVESNKPVRTDVNQHVGCVMFGRIEGATLTELQRSCETYSRKYVNAGIKMPRDTAQQTKDKLKNDWRWKTSGARCVADRTGEVRGGEPVYRLNEAMTVEDAIQPGALVADLNARLAQLQSTEREGLVKQRIGQDVFRDALMKFWNGRCAITGLDLAALLRASHAKSWASCENDMERLDPFNGFLLAPNLDALFDRFLLSFEDDGSLLFAPAVTREVLAALCLGEDSLRLSRIDSRHLPYLKWHRERMRQYWRG